MQFSNHLFLVVGVITSPNHPNAYPAGAGTCWSFSPSPGKYLELFFTAYDVSTLKQNKYKHKFTIKIHATAEADGDWITVSPAINGVSKFWGNNLQAVEAPPNLTTFPRDQSVSLCFYSRAIVNGHNGFRAEIKQTCVFYCQAQPKPQFSKTELS